jgi:hypothetical protein
MEMFKLDIEPAEFLATLNEMIDIALHVYSKKFDEISNPYPEDFYTGIDFDKATYFPIEEYTDNERAEDSGDE